MIVVRDIFHLKFGAARPFAEALKQGHKLDGKFGDSPTSRILSDLVGDSYTFVLENTYENLTEYESEMKSTMGGEGWREWYQTVIPLVESAKREIFNVVPLK